MLDLRREIYEYGFAAVIISGIGFLAYFVLNGVGAVGNWPVQWRYSSFEIVIDSGDPQTAGHPCQRDPDRMCITQYVMQRVN